MNFLAQIPLPGNGPEALEIRERARERARLNKRLDKTSRKVYRAKHNDKTVN